MRFVKLTWYSILLAVSIWFADYIYSDIEDMGLDESLLATYRICVVSYKFFAFLGFWLVFSLLVLNVVRYIVGSPSGNKVSLDKEDSEKGGI